MARSVASLFVTLALTGLTLPVEASVFLGRVPTHAGLSEEDLKKENDLLPQIESVLGSEHRVFTEKRIDSIKSSLKPIFAAIPKNADGKLGQAAVSYALYRLFVQRHAWYVKGLEPFKSMAEWNSTSPVAVIDQRVPKYITGLFHTRLGEHGFGLHEVAVLAATLEHLVHRESLVRLSSAYRALKFSKEDVLSTEEGRDLMDTYMTMYILDTLIENVFNVSEKKVRYLRANAEALYPGFAATQEFVREVADSVLPERDYLYHSDMASLVEEVGDRYGRWQDYECRALKDMLVEMEDQSTGGAGRVRLADFYRGSMYHGKWQLVEGIPYLRQLGALDESSPENLRVIIANYVYGPSNCVASSSYYQVCCVNECDEILSHLEVNIAAPEATPSRIASLISQLPSSTVKGNRTLSTWLLRRLDDVAEHHKGVVPLHGRLFAQWLHYAYPRECAFPHPMGATQAQTPDKFQSDTNTSFQAPKEEMLKIIALPVPRQKRSDETGDIEELLQLESAMWTMEEELVVEGPSTPYSAPAPWRPWVRGLAFMMAVVSGAISLVRTLDRKLPTSWNADSKYYV
mmetsp:Transcript_151315/g.277919  ORF Transcript_151315/g.277919 Transcript_151315/m.277919 type:complete len:573 (-) Transcript_151315:76-1794(-)